MYKTKEEIHQAQRKALSTIPEFCIKDMAQWFSFLAYNVLRIHPNATKGVSVSAVPTFISWVSISVV
jgi:hypothetical protein